MQAPTRFEFRQVRDLGDVLNATFVFIKQHLVPLSKSLLVIVAPFMAMASLAGASLQSALFELDATDPDAVLSIFGPAYFAALGFGMLSSLLSMLVVYGYVDLYETAGGGHPGVEAVWRVVRRRFFRLFSTLLFLLFLAVVLYLGLVFLLILLGGLVGGIVGLAAVVGMVYAFITFTLIFPMRMFESVGLTVGIQRCLYLVKNYWGQTFGVIFIAMVTYSILGTLFNLPAIIFGFVHGLHNAAVGEEGRGVYRFLMVVSGVVGGMGTSLLYAIPLVATALQYFSLVERKEKVGLMRRIERLEEREDDGQGVRDGGTP